MRTVTLATAILVWAAAAAGGETVEQQRGAAAAKFPPNKWTELGPTKVVIPKPWDSGRLKGVNSFGSEVYCDELGEILSMDGYTTAPAGKSTPNNYSDSLYGYNPMTGVFRLIKRSNWQAGARSKDPRNCSYPLDENRTEPTPCPRHTYNGICYSTDTRKFYLINGANAGVPNKHPKFEVNKGTDVFTFWEFDAEKLKWKKLEYPGVKRKEPYETVLRAIPGTNSLYLVATWSLWKYDTKEAKWSAVIPKGAGGIGSGNYGCAATVDPKRKRIVMMNGRPKVKKGATRTPRQEVISLRYFDPATKKFVPVPLFGAVEGGNKGGLAYVDHMDCYAVRTEKGLFLYFPEEEKWKKPEIAQFVPEGRHAWSWCYMNYDKVRQLLVLKRQAALRLDPKTLKLTELKVTESK
ncbi:MAG: hypothetical protein ACYTGB_09160 [Planctomycetota bacterium]|jgi:hypothetical protein